MCVSKAGGFYELRGVVREVSVTAEANYPNIGWRERDVW
jgi:hypothetical protein